MLKTTYDILSGNLTKTNEELNENFKEKIVAIKSMVATFFAKVDDQVTSNSAKTKSVEGYLNRFEANFINPAKELDGKLFGMN